MSEISDILNRIDALKAELDSYRPLDREVEERVFQKFRLWWTYHSNAIEGNKLTQGETEMFLMEGLTAKGKPLKDHLDLRGHSNAVNYLLAFIRENEVLTEASIRKLHEVLLVEAYRIPAITADGSSVGKTVSLGQYKTQPNHVRTPTGEIHYYATPIETPAKMQALVAWQRDEFDRGELHPVEISARFHHEFTRIHPFDDGNGRMARLLMNLLLMQKGFPPVVIRIGERDDYLLALRKADQGDSDGFIVFIAERVAASLDLYLRAVKGEEIHEPTDLEKEIALLKLELQHIEEPQTLTRERQELVVKKSLDPLFAEIGRIMGQFSDLFADGLVRIEGTFEKNEATYGLNRETLSLRETTAFPFPSQAREDKHSALLLKVTFELKGFKKGRFNAFDASTTVQIKFEPLKYAVELPGAKPPLSVDHFYQEQLSKDEITEIAQGLARFFLEVIRKKTAIRD